MDIQASPLKGCWVIQPKVFLDDRGFLIEVYSKQKMAEAGINVDFPYSIESRSKKNVVRGLHFQWGTTASAPVGKMIRVILGSAFVVAADIRKKSDTFGKWFGLELSAENKKVIYIEPGFAAGFAALEDETYLQYHYTAPHNPNGESNILWNDPDLKIKWPAGVAQAPILSERDKNAKTLAAWLLRPESDKF